MKLHTIAVVVASTVILAGCVQDTGGSMAPNTLPAAANVPAASSSVSTGTPSLAEQGCLRDVTRTTNNPDVVLLSSEFSQAGTQVIVGVGPQRARWSCIGYSDGSTAEITSLTNEGSL